MEEATRDMTGTAAGIPAFLEGKLSERFEGAELDRILAGYREARDRPVTLRANTLKASAETVASALDGAGIAYERVPWYSDAFVLNGVRERAVWELDVYAEGEVYLQSLSSMLPPLALEPREGADILDMCAAPGGKTSQMAALAGGRAHLTACEMNGPRAEKLSYNLDKLGAVNVNVMRMDARKLDEFFSFDQVLLDAPCTGSGTVRAGDPRAEKRLTPQLLAKVTRSQRALLDRALTVLKPGGTLVYSTCSILREENEDQVTAALKRHRDCEIAPMLLDAGEMAPEDEGPVSEKRPAPVIIPDGSQGPFAIPALPCGLPGALTVAPTRLFEGFFVCVIRKATR